MLSNAFGTFGVTFKMYLIPFLYKFSRSAEFRASPRYRCGRTSTGNAPAVSGDPGASSSPSSSSSPHFQGLKSCRRPAGGSEGCGVTGRGTGGGSAGRGWWRSRRGRPPPRFPPRLRGSHLSRTCGGTWN